MLQYTVYLYVCIERERTGIDFSSLRSYKLHYQPPVALTQQPPTMTGFPKALFFAILAVCLASPLQGAIVQQDLTGAKHPSRRGFSFLQNERAHQVDQVYGALPDKEAVIQRVAEPGEEPDTEPDEPSVADIPSGTDIDDGPSNSFDSDDYPGGRDHHPDPAPPDYQGPDDSIQF